MRHSIAMVNVLNVAKRLIFKYFERVIGSLMNISGLNVVNKILHLIMQRGMEERNFSKLIFEHLASMRSDSRKATLYDCSEQSLLLASAGF